MKKSILLFLLLLPLLSFGQRRAGPQMSPDSMAQRQTNMMTDSLTLSAAQAIKIHEVNLEFANKIKEAREKYMGDWENMRPAIQALRKEQNAAWAQFLTSDQFSQWQLVAQRQRDQRRGRRPGNRQREGKPNKSESNPQN